MVKMTMWNNCLVITIVWTFLTCTCSQVFLQDSNVCKNPRNELNSITEKFRQYFIENKNKLEQMEGLLLKRQEIFENRLDKRVSEIWTAVEQLQNQEEQKSMFINSLNVYNENNKDIYNDNFNHSLFLFDLGPLIRNKYQNTNMVYAAISGRFCLNSASVISIVYVCIILLLGVCDC